MTYYHGTSAELDIETDNPERGRYDLCLTTSRKAAENYAGDEGAVYEIDFDGYAGTPGDVVEIADERGLNRDGVNRIDVDSPYFYLLVDDPAVQKALVEEGITAVEYHDEDWENDEHDCLRVFDPKHLSLK